MNIEYTEQPSDDLIELTVHGRITQADLEALVPKIDAFTETRDQIRLLEIVNEFDGIEPAALLDGIRLDLKYIKRFSHCAVVSDKGWMGPLARLASALTSIEVRHFDGNEVETARQWLVSAE